MILLTYDITNNKVRTKFARFLEQHGSRLQYSVFILKNSRRVLNNVKTEIEAKYEKKFNDTDSVMIFDISENNVKKTIRYGYERHNEDDVIYY